MFRKWLRIQESATQISISLKSSLSNRKFKPLLITGKLPVSQMTMSWHKKAYKRERFAKQLIQVMLSKMKTRAHKSTIFKKNKVLRKSQMMRISKWLIDSVKVQVAKNFITSSQTVVNNSPRTIIFVNDFKEVSSNIKQIITFWFS